MPLIDDWKAKSDEIAVLPYGTVVYVLRHSITRLVIDAVASGDDSRGRMRGDASAAIRYEGGDGVEKESVERVTTGSAWATTAGALRARLVIHTAVTEAGMPTTRGQVVKGVTLCLELACKKSVKDLAFPAFGTGTGGMAVASSADAMAEGLLSFRVPAGFPAVESVVVVLYKDAIFEEFGAALRASLRDATSPSAP